MRGRRCPECGLQHMPRGTGPPQRLLKVLGSEELEVNSQLALL
jgi:hypothetical protein